VILLVPLGPDAERPRLPRVTTGLIAVNVAVFLVTSQVDTFSAARGEASLERVASWTLEKAGRQSPDLAERVARHPSALAFVLRDTAWPDEMTAGEDRERLLGCREDYRRLREGHPFYRLGFVPAEAGPWRLLTHLFLHADIPHLVFNMIFLWAVGGLLELAWGEGLFAAFFLASGMAAAWTHALFEAGSIEPAIGASGAVAGLMGAFAATRGRQPMRLALVSMLSFSPRISFVSWPAWVFLGLWVLEQAFYALLTAHMDAGIAFGAHLGGFAFGLVAGAALERARGCPRAARA
jgi:membrane associated rhomboid family serine protease